MAQILVSLANNKPVAAKSDTHVWGNGETYPIFYVLKVPEINTQDAADYLSNGSYVVIFDKSKLVNGSIEFTLGEFNSAMVED